MIINNDFSEVIQIQFQQLQYHHAENILHRVKSLTWVTKQQFMYIHYRIMNYMPHLLFTRLVAQNLSNPIDLDPRTVVQF